MRSKKLPFVSRTVLTLAVVFGLGAIGPQSAQRRRSTFFIPSRICRTAGIPTPAWCATRRVILFCPL